MTHRTRGRPNNIRQSSTATTFLTAIKLGEAESLIEKIENEKLRRIRRGDTAREKAQRLYAQAPDVLGGIMNDSNASPRHRVECAKELRVVADNGPQAAPPPPAERFQIIINLGNDEILKFDKTIT